MQEEEKKLRLKQEMLYFKMRKFSHTHIDENTIDIFDDTMKIFENTLDELMEGISSLLIFHSDPLGADKIEEWKNVRSSIEKDADEYRRNVYVKAKMVKKSLIPSFPSAAPMHAQSQVTTSMFQKELLEEKRRQNDILERSQQEKENERQEKFNETVRENEIKKAAAEAKAKNKVEAIHADCDKLAEKINSIRLGDWKLQSDLSIGRAMKEIKPWEDSLEKIVALKRNLDDLIASEDLNKDATEFLEVNIAVEKISQEVEFVVEAIRSEDDKRELYTLDPAKTDAIKLPTFEGRDDEDFVKFKEDVEKAFVQNRVARSDKLDKLREVLKGHAKKLVPLSITNNIDEAWEILSKAFGDPIRLMKFRKDSLLKLGNLPKENARGGAKAQVMWYLEAEALIQNILDLGKKSPDLGMEAFSTSTIHTILRLFPSHILTKLSNCPGTGSDKVSAMLKKISKLRADAQTRQLVMEAAPTQGAANVGTNQCLHAEGQLADDDIDFFDDGYDQCGGIGQLSLAVGEIQGLIAYKPPRRDEACRICKTLEANGDTYQLYDGHVHSFPTGCPRYVAMSVDDRLQIAMAAKLCLFCHDPDYTWKLKDKDHMQKCQIHVKGKSRYSCQNSLCKQHMWVCRRHKDENNQALMKFKDEMQTKYGLQFGFIVSIPNVRPSIINNRANVIKEPAKTRKATDLRKLKLMRKKMVTKEDTAVFDNKNIGKETVQVKEVKSDFISPGTAPIAANTIQKSLSPNQALKKLKKKMNANGINEELRPVPKGRAQFIIGYTKGKTEPLLTLYDTGCGSVLFKEGVPRHQLGPSVLKTKGPFIVKGVGDTTVKVNDEYICSVDLCDGTRQAMEGWTVDKITATLPSVNLTAAEAEIKASKPENQELQSLQCEPTVGGDVAILLGILYSSIHPVAIHSLPSGLTIYRMQIASHNSKHNCAIGGPHESFEFMAASPQFGSMSVVFANLCQQLQNYKEFGPPSVSKALMTVEDLKFAEIHKDWGMENLDKDLVTKEIESTEDGTDTEGVVHNLITGDTEIFIEEESAVFDKKPKSQKIFEVPTICCCCGVDLNDEGVKIVKALPAKVSVDDEEGNQILKQMMKAQNEGLNIEYRCHRCRSCSDCRRSHETERVSLREEAEDSMIWDSVKLDFENERILCYLPLRGTEEEFLTNNRDIAKKILDQQCNKYNKDEETKELIVKAFQKLLKNDQMCLWDDLNQEEKKAIESKTVSHYIPWRLVFKPSLSTPARIVFDGSQNTKHREDGSGGRCLNDAVVKGRIVTLNLVKMFLRFQVGRAAVQGDLKQFYASIKLVPEQWNLQRVLFRPDLDPNSEVVEAIIKTLIWGVKCVSGQSECSIIKLAEHVRELNPRLAELLLESRFVDDLGDSDINMETLKKLVEEADKLFSMVSLLCKGWSFSGSPPPPDVAEEDGLVSIGGAKWRTELDLLEVPLPPLHFSKKLRGRLVIGTEVFSGSSVEDMERFVPKKLTRRMIFSKLASVFDLPGKFTPVEVGMKRDLRSSAKLTAAWDDPVPDELRGKWVQNYWMLEKLKGIKFQRARMPDTAANADMELIIAVDAAMDVKIAGVWCRFKLKDGGYSCQLLIGRSLLVAEDSTIPKNELEALTMGSNLGWIVRQCLEKWISNYILICDSTISLCWISSEKKRLSLFHRNRCVQVRRGTDLDRIFHVISEQNPSDLGTRPDLVTENDVGPNSRWEVGLPWMRCDIDEALEKGILTPISDLRLKKEEEEDYNKGMVFEKSHEILTRGHPVMLHTRVENVQARLEFSNYIISPTKFKWEKVVRILSIVWRFIKSFRSRRVKALKDDSKFKMFQTSIPNTKEVRKLFENKKPTNDESDDKVIDVHRHKIASLDLGAYVEFGCEKVETQFRGKYHVLITEDDVSRSLDYFYRKGSQEVLQFNSADLVNKIAVDHDGILFSRNRILEGQRFQTAGGLEDKNILGKGEFGIHFKTPVFDRYSPLSYAIGDYVHRIISKHRGYETCLRYSLNICFIIQGMSLFRELGQDCVRCVKMRKKYLQIAEGPVSDEQLVIAPPHWVTMVDIYGPCYIYVPGHAMETRKRKALQVKCYVLVFLCPTTKHVNLQVIENKSADGVVDGINRLGCEVGFPSFVLVDQDSGILKVLKEAEVNLKDVDLVLFKERGIKFRTCPVSGHNFHGSVERKIRSVQECLDKMDIPNMRLHATGLQTVLKLIENDLNNLPLGYSYGRDSDNSPLLKLIFPNMLKIGRLNTRALDGPIRMPASPGELMEKIEKAYSTFFNIWNTTMIPKLMRIHKWYKSDEQLMVGDIIYFKKDESVLSSEWTVGRVTDVIVGKDGAVRRAIVQFQNSNEKEPRFTDRAARSLVKLFNIDDSTWLDDMHTVEKLVAALKKENEGPEGELVNQVEQEVASSQMRLQRGEGVQHRAVAKVARKKMIKPCKTCCCVSHCLVTEHGSKAVPVVVNHYCYDKEHLFDNMLDRSWQGLEEYKEEMFSLAYKDNTLMSLICSVNLDLADVVEDL